jgi:uncharacterized FlaG/YvyC family protein
MEISSINSALNLSRTGAYVSAEQAAQRRQVIQAATSINGSGMLGRNELVLSVDGQTHRPIIRVEDRETHEVIFQVPAEYVLRLADDLRSGVPGKLAPLADM